jgi:hypothetical protein
MAIVRFLDKLVYLRSNMQLSDVNFRIAFMHPICPTHTAFSIIGSFTETALFCTWLAGLDTQSLRVKCGV